MSSYQKRKQEVIDLKQVIIDLNDRLSYYRGISKKIANTKSLAMIANRTNGALLRHLGLKAVEGEGYTPANPHIDIIKRT